MRPSEVQRQAMEAIAKDEVLIAAGVTASCADDGNKFAALTKAMALGGKGVHVLVSAPSFTPTSSAARNAVGDLKLMAAVSEVPELNRKRGGHMTGADIAWRVAAILNMYKIGEDGPLLVLDGTIQASLDPNGEQVVYNVPIICTNQLLQERN